VPFLTVFTATPYACRAVYSASFREGYCQRRILRFYAMRMTPVSIEDRWSFAIVDQTFFVENIDRQRFAIMASELLNLCCEIIWVENAWFFNNWFALPSFLVAFKKDCWVHKRREDKIQSFIFMVCIEKCQSLAWCLYFMFKIPL